jgi:hypothetical protein
LKNRIFPNNPDFPREIQIFAISFFFYPKGTSLNDVRHFSAIYDLPTIFNLYTLIEFAKFGVETVSMAKTCNFDSKISDFNSVDLKKAKKWSKAKFFFKGQIWSPKAKDFLCYDFFMNLGYFAINYSGNVIGLSKKAIKAAKRP